MTTATSISLALSVAAVVIALLGFRNERSYRRQESLWKLLTDFDAARFHVLIWRMEQATRGDGELWNVNAISVTSLRATASERLRRLIDEVLSLDLDSDRAVMHEVHFFALRLHSWLGWRAWARDRRMSLVNKTFGYQLLSTLLDHRLIACRLRDDNGSETYYAVQYGCLDEAYRDLVERMASDVLIQPDLAPEVHDVLFHKYEATETRLDAIASRGFLQIEVEE